MRIAITGHRELTNKTAALVDHYIRTLAEKESDITGLTCLADGSDQIFARAVLDHGGALEVFVPTENYHATLTEEGRYHFDKLCAPPALVHPPAFPAPTPEAYMSASRLMVDTADRLWAVWDGRPARGYGGTADVVAYGHRAGVPIDFIWPLGAEREPDRVQRSSARRAQARVTPLAPT